MAKSKTSRHRSLTVALAAAVAMPLQIAVANAQDFSAVEIETLHVAGNVYMLVGAGGNMALSVGDDGILLVDSQLSPLTDAILAAIAELSEHEVSFVINTHAHADRSGGNENLRRRGATIIAHENVRTQLASGSPDDRTPDPDDRIPPAPADALPTVTFAERLTLHFNGEDIDIIAAPPGHTNGDSFVFFRGSNVLHMGDTLVTGGFPVVDRSLGGSVQGIIEGLNLGLELAIAAPGFLSGEGNKPGSWPPPSGQEEVTDTIIVPGHGRLYDQGDLVQYRDMVNIIRDRVADLVQRGMSFEQVAAADPTLGWNRWYGSDTPPYTTERFLLALYAELAE